MSRSETSRLLYFYIKSKKGEDNKIKTAMDFNWPEELRKEWPFLLYKAREAYRDPEINHEGNIRYDGGIDPNIDEYVMEKVAIVNRVVNKIVHDERVTIQKAEPLQNFRKRIWEAYKNETSLNPDKDMKEQLNDLFDAHIDVMADIRKQTRRMNDGSEVVVLVGAKWIGDGIEVEDSDDSTDLDISTLI